MYLDFGRGEDGSGKGKAARILGELLSEFPFPDVVMTHEPRRHSELGNWALNRSNSATKHPWRRRGSLLPTAWITRTPSFARTSPAARL